MSAKLTNRLPSRATRRAACLAARNVFAVAVALVCALGSLQTIVGRADAGEEIPAPGGKLSFSRDIRPILASKCFSCHGADSSKRKASMRLDTAEGAFGPAESGDKPIVPGDLEASELYWRITSDDPLEHMPPPKSGKSLTAADVDRLKAWIEQGAKYENHWSFVAPKRPPVPQVRNSTWVRNPIDAFILARLEQEGLEPSPKADQITLLRRLSLDLVGLPPTLEQVRIFSNDSDPKAFDTHVERLLSSPHYGERWGGMWLDAARYADSDGFEKDKSRQVWFYRDWVIRALNRDLPYDEFVIEQIAGDLLPGSSQDQVVATGFLRNSMTNEEGGIDPEQFRMEAMFDRMDAIGKGILGLTIQCAQCHDHKYDPLTQEEYYRMFAFLNNSHEATMAVYTPEDQKRRTELFGKMRAIEAELKARDGNWPKRMAEWEEKARSCQPEWVVVPLAVEEISNGGQKYSPLDDGSLVAQGYAPTKHRVQLSVRTDLQKITAFRLELLLDPNLPMGGPGRSLKGTCALTEFEVEAAPADAPEKTQKVKMKCATADINPPETVLEPIFDDKSGKRRVTGPVEFALDGKDDTGWGIDAGPGRRNQPRKAVFVAETPVGFPAGTVLKIFLKQNHGGWNSDDNQSNNLGRFRLSLTTAEGAQADPLPAALREVLAIPSCDRTAEQTDVVFTYWRTLVPEWRAANDAIEALWRQHPEPSTQLVYQERAKPRTTSLLQRGDFLKPVRKVDPGVPAFLEPLQSDAPVTRLTFARWLVDRNSPTAARSIVNRVWQAYFGTGLVSTSEDLGSQSEAPSHPELLDWLAVEFMDGGWSLKKLHRLIVESSTYRQSSRVTPARYAHDPSNRLLARGPRMRVEAETVRDIALAASGLLSPKMGGPSVFPPAPDFLFQPPASYGPKVWHESAGEDRHRRALYTFRYRSVPNPMLQTFDGPNGDFSCVRRAKSNTPIQALVTLNEPVFLEAARALAALALEEGGQTDAERLAFAFQRCVARKPSGHETEVLLGLLRRQTDRFAHTGVNAVELAKPEERPTLAPAQLAAWTVVSRVLLNLDETITKE